MTAETLEILKREMARCSHDELIAILTHIAPIETRILCDGTRKVVVKLKPAADKPAPRRRRRPRIKSRYA